MKIAIISDIHSNFEALSTALQYIRDQGITRIICLGDIVGYGPRPNECVEAVRENCEICLMGNHDHAVLGLTDIYYFNQYAREAVLWTKRELTRYNLAYLESLPFQYQENDILYVHSTPVHPEAWHYVFSEYDARQYLDLISQSLVFVGHSHVPAVFSYKEGSFYEPNVKIDSSRDRYIINVGSVGQPRDGDPRLCFVIFDTTEQLIQFIRLEYDVEKVYNEILEKKLPAFLAMRLLSGS